MSARTLCSLLLLAGVSLSFVLIASRHPEDANEPSTEVERIDRSVDSGQDVDRSGGYETLVTGGQLYAGTVLSVTVQKAGPRRGPGGPQEEWGSLQFRVDRTVAGPDVRELTLGYWWLEDSVDSVGTDWVCNDGPWRERPRAGQHLLLQLAGDKQVADGQIRRFGSPVCHVWRGVGGDHPLVHGFADAVKFLAAKDTKTQDQLFRRLCQSPFASLRLFAFEAAFEAIDPKEDRAGSRTVYGGKYDPVRQAQLILLYLRFAFPRISEDEERWVFTLGFSQWFGSPHAQAPAYRVPEVAGALRAAFQDWYLTELGTVDRPGSDRCYWALRALDDLIGERGSTETLALFPKGGRAALQERLRACARAQNETVQLMSQKLLEKLSRK